MGAHFGNYPRAFPLIPKHLLKEVIWFLHDCSNDTFLTKSGGELSVLFALTQEIARKLDEYDEMELEKIPVDIRGKRCYLVSNLPEDQIGGTEFHRVRQEIVFVKRGSVLWECEDLRGNKKAEILESGDAVYMPPYILHTYYVLENGTTLGVFCNTLFPLPSNSATNDTYSLEE